MYSCYLYSCHGVLVRSCADATVYSYRAGRGGRDGAGAGGEGRVRATQRHAPALRHPHPRPAHDADSHQATVQGTATSQQLRRFVSAVNGTILYRHRFLFRAFQL